MLEKLAFNATKQWMKLFRVSLQQQQDPASQLHSPGGQEGEEAGGDEEEESQTSAVWRFLEEQTSGDTTLRNPSAGVTLEVRSYPEEPLFQRGAEPLSWLQTNTSVYPRLTYVMARRPCIGATTVL